MEKWKNEGMVASVFPQYSITPILHSCQGTLMNKVKTIEQ